MTSTRKIVPEPIHGAMLGKAAGAVLGGFLALASWELIARHESAARHSSPTTEAHAESRHVTPRLGKTPLCFLPSAGTRQTVHA